MKSYEGIYELKDYQPVKFCTKSHAYYDNMNLSLDIDIIIDIRFHGGNQQLKSMGYIWWMPI